jgi:hypothetical protein
LASKLENPTKSAASSNRSAIAIAPGAGTVSSTDPAPK